MTPVMKKPDKESLSWIPLAGLVAAALPIVFLIPASIAQRAVAFIVICVSLAWLVILLLLLARTPEGHGRLRSSPPLAFDMLSAVPVVACTVLVDAIGTSGSGGGASVVGAAAGAVMIVPFSFTVRWLWWEHKRRRITRWTADR